MGILRYALGHHAGGFIGYRVTRTIGSDKDHRTRYFSEKKLGWKEALRQAELQDERWAKAALLKRRSMRVIALNESKKTGSKSIIVDGFRAIIEVDRAFRAGEYRTYFSPGFQVWGLSAKIPFFFRIKKLGYRCAYIKAAEKYGDIHELSANSRLALVAKMPDRSLFTGFLRKRLASNGHRLTIKALNELLG